MTRVTTFSSPLLLGFDTLEKNLERITRGNDGFPPYNIERIVSDQQTGDVLRITLAVAGFSNDDLEVTTEENELIIRGRQTENNENEYLHRGIAARQFQRIFMLADGMQVLTGELKNGLLAIDLIRPKPDRLVRRINISVTD